MKVRELINLLAVMDPEDNACVALFKTDGTSETFDVEEISDTDGTVQLEIYEAE